MFGAIGMMLLTYWKRHSYPTNLLFLSGFTLLEAYTISVVVSFYKTSIVLNAVLLTAGIFVFLTAFACQTKYDFTSWMPYLFGGLWGLILFGFMAAFFPYSSTGELIYGGLAALIFSGYILVDTRKHQFFPLLRFPDLCSSECHRVCHFRTCSRLLTCSRACHATPPCRGGDRSCYQPVPRHHQPVPGHPAHSEQPAEQLNGPLIWLS